AAYEMQPAARLRETHARAGAVLADLHADDPDGVAASLGRHLDAAGLPAAAVEHHRRAARAAERLPAPPAARTHLGRALAAVVASDGPSATHVEVLRDLAGNAVAMGDYGMAVDELTEALSLVEPDEDPTRLHHALGGALARWGRLEEAEAAYEA